MPRAVTTENWGAWLLRCNPKNEPELAGLIASGSHRIERWCVADNYRTRMMSAGDPVLFWISGDGRLLVRGIWGIGRIVRVTGLSGPLYDLGESPSESHDRPTAEVDIPLLSEGISDAELRAEGIGDLEVQVQPQGSNPSWISREQMRRLSGLFPAGSWQQSRLVR